MGNRGGSRRVLREQKSCCSLLLPCGPQSLLFPPSITDHPHPQLPPDASSLFGLHGEACHGLVSSMASYPNPGGFFFLAQVIGKESVPQFLSLHHNERVTGRKAQGLQTEGIGCKCQTFFSLSLKQAGGNKLSIEIFFS